MLSPHVCAYALLCFAVTVATAATSNISNALPRRDTSGTIMDSHDGSTFYDPNSKQYLSFGASYGLCKEPAGDTGCAPVQVNACGFQLNHNVSMFSSKDLTSWTSHGVVFQMAEAVKNMSGLTSAILFCPKVIYNPGTKKWVLWVNYIQNGDFALSFYASAVAPSPDGPYEIVNSNITLANADVGDFALYADTDGQAYVIYTSLITASGANHRMSIDRLTPDFLSSTKVNSGFFGASGVEAPTLFKRGSTYYAIFGSCCCYCKAGSAVVAHTATSPMGPWTTLGPIDRTSTSAAVCPPRPAFSRQAGRYFDDADGAEDACVGASNIHAQQTNVVTYYDDAGVAQYMWQGDGWQQVRERCYAAVAILLGVTLRLPLP